MSHDATFDVEASDGAEETKSTFDVVVVCDDRSAARRAMKFFNELVREFGDEFEFHCELWRFDWLDVPKIRAAAVLESSVADLLIISAQCDADLPAPVKDWLNRCIAEKTPGSSGLVAMLESHRSRNDMQCRTRQFLQSAANRGGLDFFLHEVDLPEIRPASTSNDARDGAIIVSSALEGIRQQNKPSRRWRGNE
jgi:hypothetical protein